MAEVTIHTFVGPITRTMPADRVDEFCDTMAQNNVPFDVAAPICDQTIPEDN